VGWTGFTLALARGVSVERSETTAIRTLAVLAALWRRLASAEAAASATEGASAQVSIGMPVSGCHRNLVCMWSG
jgi:hypothetical protein